MIGVGGGGSVGTQPHISFFVYGRLVGPAYLRFLFGSSISVQFFHFVCQKILKVQFRCKKKPEFESSFGCKCYWDFLSCSLTSKNNIYKANNI